MPDKLNGTALAATGVGILFVYSGVRGTSILAMLREITAGKSPKTAVTETLTGATSASAGPGSLTGNQAIAWSLVPAAWQADSEWSALVALWNQESGWRADATNPGSGAYGIPQALPASKMESAGADWKTSPATQIRWGIGYIKDRYGDPVAAEAHEKANGWY